jgi:hypothetical protein
MPPEQLGEKMPSFNLLALNIELPGLRMSDFRLFDSMLRCNRQSVHYRI